MAVQVSIAIGGTEQQFPIDYLSPLALEYWQAWVQHRAFLLFANSLNTNPTDLVIAKVQEKDTPKLFSLEAAMSSSSVVLLLKLFTGLDLTPDDPGKVFIAVSPYIQKIERTATWEEVNKNRVAQGKSPLGQSTPIKPPHGKRKSPIPPLNKGDK